MSNEIGFPRTTETTETLPAPSGASGNGSSATDFQSLLTSLNQTQMESADQGSTTAATDDTSAVDKAANGVDQTETDRKATTQVAANLELGNAQDATAAQQITEEQATTEQQSATPQDATKQTIASQQTTASADTTTTQAAQGAAAAAIPAAAEDMAMAVAKTVQETGTAKELSRHETEQNDTQRQQDHHAAQVQQDKVRDSDNDFATGQIQTGAAAPVSPDDTATRPGIDPQRPAAAAQSEGIEAEQKGGSPSQPGTDTQAQTNSAAAVSAQIAALSQVPGQQQAAAFRTLSETVAAQPDTGQRFVLMAQLMQQLAAMPNESRGSALASFMSALDTLPTVNRGEALRKLLDGDFHQPANDFGAAGQVATNDNTATSPAHVDQHDAAARAPTMDTLLRNLSDVEQQQITASEAGGIAYYPAEQQKHDIAQGSIDGRALNAPPSAGRVIEGQVIEGRLIEGHAGEARPLEISGPDQSRGGIAGSPHGLHDQPLAVQGQAWSGAVWAARDMPVESSVVRALTRHVDLAMDSNTAESDIADLMAMVRQLPARDRLPPMMDMLQAAPHMPETLCRTIHAQLMSAARGLPPHDRAQLKQEVQIQRDSISATVLNFSAAIGSMATPDPAALNRAPLPNPLTDGHAFARAVESVDRSDAGEAVESRNGRPGSERPGDRAGVVVFARPGLPRFHSLMERLSREHPRLMEHDVRGYRQAVDTALETGSIHVSMSPRYNWPSNCDRDEQGQYLITINPNLMAGDFNKIVNALIVQMRRAALLRCGQGAHLLALHERLAG